MSDTPELPPPDLNPYEPPIYEAELAEPRKAGGLFLDSSRRLRTPYRLFIFGVGIFVILIIVNIVVGIAVGVYLLATGVPDASNPDELADALNAYLAENMALLTALTAPPMTALSLGWVIVCRRFIDWRSIASMGFVRPQGNPLGSMFVAFFVGAVPIIAAALAIWAIGGYRLAESSPTLVTLLVIPAFVLMAFVEEIIFRSYVLQNLLDIRRPIFAVIFSSVVFWLVHFMNPHAWSSPLVAVNLFGAGVVLALAYMVSRNIWFPTVLHFAWNFTQGVVLGIPVSGVTIDGIIRFVPAGTLPEWVTGGKFGLEASIVCTVAEFAVAAILLAMLVRSEKQTVME